MLPTIAYEPDVKITIDGDEVHVTSFIQSFYVYRMPFVKMASFSILTLPLHNEAILKLDAYLKQGKLPQLNIKIYIADMREREGKYGYLRKELTFNNFYNIVHLVQRQPLTSQTPVIPVSLYLTQIQFHDMANGNSYNTVLRELTALQALADFESYLTKRYGSCFKPARAGVTSKTANKDLFEQILIKSSSDMMVPQLILNTYKPLNALGYYFFDEMMITNAMNSGLLTCLNDTKSFEPFDVYDEGFDVTNTLRLKNSVQFVDRFDTLRKNVDSSSITMRNRYGITKVDKTKETVETPRISQSDSHTRFLENSSRRIASFPENPNVNYKKHKSNQHLGIYAPDSFESAQTRYENLKRFIDENAESLYQYEAYMVHLDAIQFNRKYNFDFDYPNIYYVPISIVNVLHRINPHESPISHTCHFQCVKYHS